MKKILFIIIFNILLINIYAFDIEKDLYFWGINVHQALEKHGNIIAFYRKGFYDTKDLKDLTVNENGWYESSVFGNKHAVIYGGDFFIYYDYKNPELSFYDPNADKNKKKWSIEETVNNKIFYCGDRRKLVKKITVPDALKETINGKEIIYNTFDMEHFFVHLSDEYITFFKDSNPWATSKEPVGLEITVDYYEPYQFLTILNGYVNPTNQSLYKKNRRLKTIKIINNDSKSEPFELVVNFEDTVHFEEIKFPCTTSSVKIKIMDYYEGSKYKDLCVQYIGSKMNLNFYDNNPTWNTGTFEYEENNIKKWNSGT